MTTEFYVIKFSDNTYLTTRNELTVNEYEALNFHKSDYASAEAEVARQSADRGMTAEIVASS